MTLDLVLVTFRFFDEVVPTGGWGWRLGSISVPIGGIGLGNDGGEKPRMKFGLGIGLPSPTNKLGCSLNNWSFSYRLVYFPMEELVLFLQSWSFS